MTHHLVNNVALSRSHHGVPSPRGTASPTSSMIDVRTTRLRSKRNTEVCKYRERCLRLHPSAPPTSRVPNSTAACDMAGHLPENAQPQLKKSPCQCTPAASRETSSQPASHMSVMTLPSVSSKPPTTTWSRLRRYCACRRRMSTSWPCATLAPPTCRPLPPV